MTLRKVLVALGLLLAGASSAAAQSGAAEGGSATQDSESGVQQESSSVETPGADLIPADRLLWHVPDPQTHGEHLTTELERARAAGDKGYELFLTRVREQLESIRREDQLYLTLEDAIRRALANSFAIEVQRYNPAIETTRVVEAEAAFDAFFFSNLTKNKVDRPTGSQLFAGDLDQLNLEAGVRQLLAPGTQVGAAWSMQRQKTSLRFQQINPEYFSDLALEMRQPLLRGFGVDYNRAFIILARHDRRISRYAFERQVRDTIREVEEAYWRLVQARRDVVITARLLADFDRIYEYLQARREYDVMEVQLAATKANLEQARADFIVRRASVRDAEDRLTAAMNDPRVDLADDTEIIAVDLPILEPVAVDRLAEVQTALDHRPEIKEQELRVKSAKVLVGRAKVDELPRLDLTFRYTVDGLATNADKAFDEVSRHKFVEYFVGVELEIPLGNRARRAARRRAELQQAQAGAQLRSIFEQVILDVNLATRRLNTSYDQIGPAYEAAGAREREVDSIVARAERLDINTLNSELNARQSLAGARRAMVGAMVDYNIALVDLERAKGTLLRYYNVVVPESEE